MELEVTTASLFGQDDLVSAVAAVALPSFQAVFLNWPPLPASKMPGVLEVSSSYCSRPNWPSCYSAHPGLTVLAKRAMWDLRTPIVSPFSSDDQLLLLQVLVYYCTMVYEQTLHKITGWILTQERFILDRSFGRRLANVEMMQKKKNVRAKTVHVFCRAIRE